MDGSVTPAAGQGAGLADRIARRELMAFRIFPAEPTEAMERAFEAAYWAKANDMYSPTPTERYKDGGGAFGYGYRAMLGALRAEAIGSGRVADGDDAIFWMALYGEAVDALHAIAGDDPSEGDDEAFDRRLYAEQMATALEAKHQNIAPIAWRDRAAMAIEAIAADWPVDGRAYAKTLAAILMAEAS